MAAMGGMVGMGGIAAMGGIVGIVRMGAGQVNIYTGNGRHFLDGI